jgi:hypothetical protein
MAATVGATSAVHSIVTELEIATASNGPVPRPKRVREKAGSDEPNGDKRVRPEDDAMDRQQQQHVLENSISPPRWRGEPLISTFIYFLLIGFLLAAETNVCLFAY